MRLLNKIRVSALVCTLGFLPGAEAQTQADSDHIYFRQGSSVIDSSMGDNGRILESWSERFPGSDEFPEMPELQILLRGSACPDGSTATSERLAEERAAVLCGWLCEHTSIPRERITVTACGIDWQGLEELVIADTACPARAEVLHILQNTPEWICDARDRVIDGRKKQLMDLRGGIPYKYMAEKMFPALRNVAVVVSGEAATAASGERAPLAGSETPKSPPPSFRT